MTKPAPRENVLAIDIYVPGKSAGVARDGARVFKLGQ